MVKPREEGILRRKMTQRDTLLSPDLPNILREAKIASVFWRNMMPCVFVRKFHTYPWKSFEEITAEYF